MIEYGIHCHAEVHSKHCTGLAEDVDHFSPRCIAKLWGWTAKQIDHPYNVFPVNRHCHELKDKDTVKRKEVLKYQLSGGTITFAEHRALFLGGLELKDIVEKKPSL